MTKLSNEKLKNIYDLAKPPSVLGPLNVAVL